MVTAFYVALDSPSTLSVALALTQTVLPKDLWLSDREQRIFLNALRLRANDLHLPLVCVGTHEAKQVQDAWTTDYHRPGAGPWQGGAG